MFKVNELLEATGGRLVRRKANIPVKGISLDSRTIQPQDEFISVKGDNFDGNDFIPEALKKKAGCIIYQSGRFCVRPSSAAIFIEVKDTVKALGDIARFQRQKFKSIPVIAITGSNGKTTTKEMAAGVLSEKFQVLKNEGTKNNQIGLPMTLLNLDSKYDLVVLELGTNHFGEIDYLAGICQPNIGIITNIGPAHLEYFHNLSGVFKEKYTLIEHLSRPKLAILNADDPLLRRQVLKKTHRPFIVGFGIKHQADFMAQEIKRLKTGLEFLVNPTLAPRKNRSHIAGSQMNPKFALGTPGYYNIYNALAAIALGRIFGLTYRQIASGLVRFQFPKGRLSVTTINEIRFIDDTYNSNPLSLKQALEALDNFKTKGRKIFVMGDMLELGRHKESFHCQAARYISQVCDVLITVGDLAKLTAQALKTGNFLKKNIFICASTRQAGEVLFQQISPGRDDIILVKGSRAIRMEEIFSV